jgi:hypothetical protein
MSMWSKHSSRTLRTQREASALAFGAREARQNDFDAFRGKHRIKAGGKLRITVVQQKPHRAPFFLQLPHQLTWRYASREAAVGWTVQPTR